MFKRISGVLLDLNETEREVLAGVLKVAEAHLDEMPKLRKPVRQMREGGPYFESRMATRVMSRALIDGLREELGLPSAEDVEPVQN